MGNTFMRLFLTACLVGTFISLFAQQRETDLIEAYRRDQAHLQRAEILREMDSAVYFADINSYREADQKFRYVLANLPSLPSEFAYHFGRNSYHLGKYRQSIDWLNKYIQLKGTTGQYYEQAVRWLDEAEKAFVELRKKEASQAEAILSKDYSIDCGPGGLVICPVCRGTHVVVKSSTFGNTYATCSFCDEHGHLTCTEYNLLLKGELEPKSAQ